MPTNTPASFLALMPMPNQRDTEKRKDKEAAERIIQSALVNMLFSSATKLSLFSCRAFFNYRDKNFDSKDNMRENESGVICS
ncbi:MAG: hypothetical protein ACYDCG_06440 [Candidatus Acidiferrales bacterium]